MSLWVETWYEERLLQKYVINAEIIGKNVPNLDLHFKYVNSGKIHKSFVKTPNTIENGFIRPLSISSVK